MQFIKLEYWISLIDDTIRCSFTTRKQQQTNKQQQKMINVENKDTTKLAQLSMIDTLFYQIDIVDNTFPSIHRLDNKLD